MGVLKLPFFMDKFSKLSFGALGWGDELLIGSLMTISLALASVMIGIVVSILLTIFKIQPWSPLRGVAHGITLLFRGTPEFLIILIVFFGIDLIINTLLTWLAIESAVITPKFWAGAMGLGLIFGVYASDVFKGAFFAVSKGIIEAGHSLGLSRLYILCKIHIPLMIRFAIPGLMNLWLVLLKDTSLVAVIAFNELLRTAKVAGESEREPFLFFFTAAIIYLGMAWVSERFRRFLDTRIKLADSDKC